MTYIYIVFKIKRENIKNMKTKKFKDFHFPEFYKKLGRKMATIHIKDSSLIIGYCYIGKEDSVLEIGSGSGFLTASIARIAKKITSYEIRKDAYEIAKENMKKLNLENAEIINEDGKQASGKYDVAVIDIPDANEAIENTSKLLEKNGRITCHCLNIEQAKLCHLEMEKYFEEVFTLSSIVPEYIVRESATRPEHWGLMHTSYLVFGRRRKEIGESK